MADRIMRWQNALGRAVTEKVRPTPVDGNTYFVPSSTDPQRAYLVLDVPRGMICTCPAGSWHVPCKHAASVLLRQGIVDPTWEQTRRARQEAGGDR